MTKFTILLVLSVSCLANAEYLVSSGITVKANSRATRILENRSDFYREVPFGECYLKHNVRPFDRIVPEKALFTFSIYETNGVIDNSTFNMSSATQESITVEELKNSIYEKFGVVIDTTKLTTVEQIKEYILKTYGVEIKHTTYWKNQFYIQSLPSAPYSAKSYEVECRFSSKITAEQLYTYLFQYGFLKPLPSIH